MKEEAQALEVNLDHKASLDKEGIQVYQVSQALEHQVLQGRMAVLGCQEEKENLVRH